MSFLRQLAEVSFEEASIISFGEQLRYSEGLTPSATGATTTAQKPSSSSAASPEQEEAFVETDGESISSGSVINTLPPCHGPNACFDCCTGLLAFLAVLPLVTFIPAMVLQRISTTTVGGNTIDGLSRNGYGFEVDGNWVAALSPIIVLLVLATIALIRVCCCAVCCGASGTRSDTDDHVVASLEGDIIRVPATVRVFPAFNSLREHLRNNKKEQSQKENREEEEEATISTKSTAEAAANMGLSESDAATVAWEALLVDGGNAGTVDANKARRKVIAIIWMLAIVQFIVLCVRLNDNEAGQIQGIQSAVGDVISAVSGSSDAAAEMITAQRMQCGSSTLAAVISANTTSGSGKSGTSLVDDASVNGLVSVPYPDRSWTATFIPTMFILLFILIDQLVLVEAAHIARIDFTKEETTSTEDKQKNDIKTTTDTTFTDSQRREQMQQQANKNSVLLSHAPALVRLIDVVAVILSFALFVCRMDGTYPYDCNSASTLTSSPWLTVLLPIIISLLLDCAVSLARGAWLSFSISGSFSLMPHDIAQSPQQVPTVVTGEATSANAATTTSDIPFITNITTMIGCCDQVRKRMIRRTFYNIVKDAFVCVAALVYVVLLALALDGRITLSSSSSSSGSTTTTTVSEVVRESLLAAITPLSISASQWHIVNIPMYVTIGVGTVALCLRILLPTSKVGF